MAVTIELVARGVMPLGHLDDLMKDLPPGTMIDARTYGDGSTYHSVKVWVEDISIDEANSVLATIGELANGD